jgi:hypothetical protein
MDDEVRRAEGGLPRAEAYELLRACGARVTRRGKFELLRLEEPGSRVPSARHVDMLEVFAGETNALYRSDTSPYWNRRAGYLNELSELWTVHRRGALIGWAGLSVIESDAGRILYIDTLNIRPRALRFGFGEYSLASVFIHEIFIRYYSRHAAPLPFVFRTQNPHVYRLARSIVPRGVYPRVDKRPGRDPERALAVAQAVARALSPSKRFDSEGSVVQGAYGGCLYGAASPALHTNEAALASFWQRHLDVTRGDAMVIVVLPTLAEAATLGLNYSAAVLRDKAEAVARNFPGGLLSIGSRPAPTRSPA